MSAEFFTQSVKRLTNKFFQKKKNPKQATSLQKKKINK